MVDLHDTFQSEINKSLIRCCSLLTATSNLADSFDFFVRILKMKYISL